MFSFDGLWLPVQQVRSASSQRPLRKKNHDLVAAFPGTIPTPAKFSRRLRMRLVTAGESSVSVSSLLP